MLFEEVTGLKTKVHGTEGVNRVEVFDTHRVKVFPGGELVVVSVYVANEYVRKILHKNDAVPRVRDRYVRIPLKSALLGMELGHKIRQFNVFRKRSIFVSFCIPINGNKSEFFRQRTLLVTANGEGFNWDTIVVRVVDYKFCLNCFVHVCT